MKVNDYVRTKHGIAQIIEEKHDKFILDRNIIFARGLENTIMKDLPSDLKQITKVHENIRELIQEDDLVNGKTIVYRRMCNYIDKGFYDIDMGEEFFYKIDNMNIDTIVTSEQLEEWAYKVSK